MPQSKCQNNRLHKCQTCGRWGCKSRNHSQNRPTGRPQAHVTAFDYDFLMGLIHKLKVQAQQPLIIILAFRKCLISTLERLISSRMEKVDGQPQASASYSGSRTLSQQAPDLVLVLGTAKNYGMPAVTALPNHLSISILQLGKKTFCGHPLLQQGFPSPSIRAAVYPWLVRPMLTYLSEIARHSVYQVSYSFTSCSCNSRLAAYGHRNVTGAYCLGN